MKRRGIRPVTGLRSGRQKSEHGFFRALPFRRSRTHIIVVSVFAVGFLIPAVEAILDGVELWSTPEHALDWVALLFMIFETIAWLVVPFALFLVVWLMSRGRESLAVTPGQVEIVIGLPFLGIGARYETSSMRNLRLEQAAEKSARAWRGQHLVFDYGANSFAIGSDMDEGLLAAIRRGIETHGGPLREGEATPDELEGNWESAPPPDDPIAAGMTEANGPVPTLTSGSSIALIIANLVPVAGALFLGWDLTDVMLLYWAESLVIGFFNVIKLIIVGRWAAVFMAPFFSVHFGGFMAGHFMFIYWLFIEGVNGEGTSLEGVSDALGLFAVLWPALAALFVSHAWSFFTNFIGRGEFRRTTASEQMMAPYSRIIFMHLVLIGGGFLVLALGQPAPVLLLVIAAKTAVDLRAHLKQREPKGNKTARVVGKRRINRKEGSFRNR